MAEPPSINWRTTLRRRFFVVAGGLLLWSAAIEGRLVYLQVFRHVDLLARADRQQSRTVEVAAKRGEILDRNGHALAYSVDADSIYIVPTEVDDPDRATAALCVALSDCSAEERRQIAERIRRGRAFAYVRRQTTPEQSKRVADLHLEGVGFMKESRRFYPNRELAAHLLGYVGVDNRGLAGIESTYDKLIKGLPGTLLIQTDAKRQPFSRVERPSTTGATLELTIDEYLQHIAERELEAGVAANRAAGGTAVIMDPWTAEILAMANAPTFNPNAYREGNEEARRNRAIQDLYEPGSTFKIVTASAALEQGFIQPNDLIDVRGGRLQIGTRVIHDTHDYGILSFTDVLVVSSNIGAIKVGLRLGKERMGMYARRFGFGKPTSPDFPAENPGIIWDPAQQTESALASMAMGYQVGVTPLQMAAAVSSVANGGELFEPRVVRAVVKDGRRLPVPHKVVRHTIAPGIANELTAIMEQVVERGTATMVKLPDYTVAGKTGTAAKLVNGRYSRTDYNASFVGFVPSRKPVFAIVVVLDSPHGPNGYYGGPVAGPIFKQIAVAAMRQYGVPPSINPAPPVLVNEPKPKAPEPVFPGADPKILPVVNPGSGADVTFPDLRGLSARDALRILAQIGMTARLNGTGIVVRQEPQPGTTIDRGDVSNLWLDRQIVGTGGSSNQP